MVAGANRGLYTATGTAKYVVKPLLSHMFETHNLSYPIAFCIHQVSSQGDAYSRITHQPLIPIQIGRAHV